MITAEEAKKRSDGHVPAAIWVEKILKQIEKEILEATNHAKYEICFTIEPAWIMTYTDENGFIPIQDILTPLRECGYKANFYDTGDGFEVPLFYLIVSWN